MSTGALVTADSFRINKFGTPDASQATACFAGNGRSIGKKHNKGMARVWRPEHNLNGCQVNK